MNREINFILERFKLGLLENKEYKINLLMVLLFDISIILATLTLLLVLEKNTNITNWSSFDYVVFLTLALFNGKINFAITFRGFSQTLLSGDFNLFAIKPISPFWFLLSQRFNGANTASLIFLVTPLLITLTLFKENILLGYLILIIGIIQCTLLFWLIEIIAFYVKDTNFIAVPVRRITWFFEEYVPAFFKGTSFFYLLGLIPSVIFAFLTTEIFNNSFQYIFLLKYAIISIPIFIILNIKIWKNGIKKYEAFG